MAAQVINHRERIETCLSGQEPDRVPVALWRHFPVDDQTPGGLAAATAHFQREFDFDFIKVTPASSFCLRDWGITDTWQGNPEGTRDFQTWAIHSPDDWVKLPVLDPRQGALGAQLECLKLLQDEFGPGLPILQTIFSPLSQARHLVAPGELPTHIHKYPDLVAAGLQRVAETTVNFIEEVIKTGIAGIFFAVQAAQYAQFSLTEFQRFGKSFDFQVLEPAQKLWLNLLHLHGENLMFDDCLDYPVQIINWHDRQTPPTLSEAQSKFNGVVCGGIRQWETMVLGTPEDVLAEANDAFMQTDNRKFILGTGCVVPVTAPYGNILAARKSVENSIVV
jgi:uroporphyrinogen decarboxylase